MEKVNLELQKEIKGNEALTLATVIAVLGAALLTMVVWKLFVSGKGKIQIPGGFKFEWQAAKTAISSIFRR